MHLPPVATTTVGVFPARVGLQIAQIVISRFAWRTLYFKKLWTSKTTTGVSRSSAGCPEVGKVKRRDRPFWKIFDSPGHIRRGRSKSPCRDYRPSSIAPWMKLMETRKRSMSLRRSIWSRWISRRPDATWCKSTSRQ